MLSPLLPVPSCCMKMPLTSAEEQMKQQIGLWVQLQDPTQLSPLLVPRRRPQMWVHQDTLLASGTGLPGGEVQRAPGASALTREWGKQSAPSKSLSPVVSEQRAGGGRDAAGAAPGGYGFGHTPSSPAAATGRATTREVPNSMPHSMVEPFSIRTGTPHSHQELGAHLGCPGGYTPKPRRGTQKQGAAPRSVPLSLYVPPVGNAWRWERLRVKLQGMG